MAVIVIIGMIVGGVAVSVGSGGQKFELRNSAKRFLALSELARDEATLGYLTLGLKFDEEAGDDFGDDDATLGYRWFILQEEEPEPDQSLNTNNNGSNSNTRNRPVIQIKKFYWEQYTGEEGFFEPGKWPRQTQVEVLFDGDEPVSYTHLTLPTTPYV